MILRDIDVVSRSIESYWAMYWYASLSMLCIDMLLCATPMCSVRTPMHLFWDNTGAVRYQWIQCEHLCDTNVFSVNTNAPVLGRHLCEHLCDTNMFSVNTKPLCATICSVRALLVCKRYPRGFQLDFGPRSVSFGKLHSIQSSRLGSGFTAVVPLVYNPLF